MGGETGTFQTADTDTSGIQKQTPVLPVTVAMVTDVPRVGPTLNGSASSTRNVPSGSSPAGSNNDSYVIVPKYSLYQGWIKKYIYGP